MKFNKTISIFGTHQENPPPGGVPWGPGKVVHNLLMGLDKLGIKYSYEKEKEGDYNILVNGAHEIFQKVSPSPNVTLLGPCVDSCPIGISNNFNEYSHFICASDWNKKYFEEYIEKLEGEKTVDSWPVGIDTNFYKSSRKKPKYDCLLHYKHPRAGFDGWEIFEKIVKKFKLKTSPNRSQHLVDGQYTGEQLVERCNSCKFLIVISGSETQGIGKMEMMSTNTPLFVLDSNCHWAFGYFWSSFPASSMPFWSDECGMLLHEKDFTKEYFEVAKPSCTTPESHRRLTSWRKEKLPKKERSQPIQGKTPKIRYIYKNFDKFLNNLTNYTPRAYILREHTLEKSARNLIKIFKKYDK